MKVELASNSLEGPIQLEVLDDEGLITVHSLQTPSLVQEVDSLWQALTINVKDPKSSSLGCFLFSRGDQVFDSLIIRILPPGEDGIPKINLESFLKKT